MKLTLQLITLGMALTSMAQGAPEPKSLNALLEPILAESKLPSLVAAVVVGDEIVAVGSAGVRKLGDPTPVTSQDKYHIGSCTKSMTATLTAILIEDGLLNWNTTIGEVLAKKTPNLHRDYREVTIEQLLAHVGGLPGQSPPNPWAEAWKNQGEMPPAEQRMRFVTDILSAQPAYKPGSKAVYSNQGYAVAGVMLESLAGKPWEDLMQERLFVPLDMKSAGYRAPCSPDRLDQPWGHGAQGPNAPEPNGDNPSAIAPAGMVHASIADWAKFARFHLQRKPGGILEKKESFDRLHSTLKNSQSYGVGGWAVQSLPQLGGHFVQMAGSNTEWLALCWIVPGQNMAIVVATNSGAPNAFQTCDKTVATLAIEFRKAAARADSPITRVGQRKEYAKAAPFTGVRWENDRPVVRVQGQWSPLVSIDGLPIERIMEFAQKEFGAQARKRFAEDLVELLSKMGRDPEWNVTLALEKKDGAVEKSEETMTEENRRLLRRSR